MLGSHKEPQANSPHGAGEKMNITLGGRAKVEQRRTRLSSLLALASIFLSILYLIIAWREIKSVVLKI